MKRQRVLILGGNGMLGHKLWLELNTKFDCFVTIRDGLRSEVMNKIFTTKRTIKNISADNINSVFKALTLIKPQVVINCIGIVKQAVNSKDIAANIQINALFPHQLAGLCQKINTKLIHMSTDCVFSGKTGNYKENDPVDAKDLYGLTKYLGEVTRDNCLTIRTSIIGHELKSNKGLLEWFLSQEGKTVKGYRNAIFSGLTTNVLADIIYGIIVEKRSLSGIWHISSAPISKYDLLRLIKKIYKVNIEIVKDKSLVINRSLNSDRFQSKFGYSPFSWEKMIKQMHKDYLFCQKSKGIYV